MKTPTTVLLVVIAALLAANLVVNLPGPEAKAQTHLKATMGDDDSPRLVGISVLDAGGSFRYILRLWSDGVVEQRIAHANPVGPLYWDVPPVTFTGWTEIVPLP